MPLTKGQIEYSTTMSEEDKLLWIEQEKVKYWYRLFLDALAGSGLNLKSSIDLLRIKGYKKPNYDIIPKVEGEMLIPFAHISLAPDLEEQEKFLGLMNAKEELTKKITFAGDELICARKENRPQEEVARLKEEYEKSIESIREACVQFETYRAEIFADYYTRLGMSVRLADPDNPSDYPTIELLYNLSHDKLLILEDNERTENNFKIIFTDIDDIVMISESAAEMNNMSPMIDAVATIVSARHFSIANIEGKTYDEEFIKARNDFGTLMLAYRDNIIIDGRIATELISKTRIEMSFEQIDLDYQRVMSGMVSYLENMQPLVAPAGLEDRFNKVADALKVSAHKLELLYKTADYYTGRVDSLSGSEKADYDYLMDWTSKEEAVYNAKNSMARLLGSTIKTADGVDTGKYDSEVLEKIQIGIATLQRFNTHSIQGDYTSIAFKKFDTEIKGLYNYELFKQLVNSVINQQNLLAILEGPGMRAFDHALRAKAAEAMKRKQ